MYYLQSSSEASFTGSGNDCILVKYSGTELSFQDGWKSGTSSENTNDVLVDKTNISFERVCKTLLYFSNKVWRSKKISGLEIFCTHWYTAKLFSYTTNYKTMESTRLCFSWSKPWNAHIRVSHAFRIACSRQVTYFENGTYCRVASFPYSSRLQYYFPEVFICTMSVYHHMIGVLTLESRSLG